MPCSDCTVTKYSAETTDLYIKNKILIIKLFLVSAAFHEIGDAAEGPNIVKAIQNAQHNKSYSKKNKTLLFAHLVGDVNNMLNPS